MTGLAAKVRLITLGNLHELLDVVIDINSIPEVKQLLRDLEHGREQLAGTLAEKKLDLTLAQQHLATHTASVEQIKKNIVLLNDAGKGDSAKKLALTAVSYNRMIEQDKAEIATDQDFVGKLEIAVAQVKAREAQLGQQLASLQAMEATSKAQGEIAGTLKALGSTMSAGASVDGLSDRIRHRAARNQAAFDAALGAMDTPADASTDAEADVLLAQLTAKPKAAEPSAA